MALYPIPAANNSLKPTAPAARASGGETRLEAGLLAEGLFPHSARRVMLTVGRPNTPSSIVTKKNDRVKQCLLQEMNKFIFLVWYLTF